MAQLLVSELPVKLTYVESVLPSAPSASSPLFLSIVDRIVDGPVNTVFFYPAGRSGGDVVAKLRQALEDVLVPYHFLAGRFSPDKEFIDCNRAGALFAAASSPLSIAELGEITQPNPEFAKLVLSVNDVTLSDQPLLTIQVTKFKCGGWSLGLSTRHAVLDGIATCEFLTNLAAVARGAALVVEPKPDRSMLKPREPPQVEFKHLEYRNVACLPTSTSKIFKTFAFPADMVERLKALATSDPSLDRCSTFAAVTAHVWRVRTRALNMPPLAPSIASFVVSVRSRVTAPLPDGFAGNAILDAHANVAAKELLNKSLAFAVLKIQEAIRTVDDEYIRSLIDSGTSLDFRTLLAPVLEGGMLLTAWYKIPFHLVDFGWGRPIYVNPIPDDSLDLVLLLHNGTEHGLNLCLGLEPSHMIEFEKLIYDF